MPQSNAAVRQQLQNLLGRSGFFDDLTQIQREPPFTPPDPATVLLARLDNGSLTVLEGHDDSTVVTLDPVEVSPTERKDAGIALPNGIYFIAQQAGGDGRFPIFRLSLGGGQTTFSLIAINLNASDDAAGQAVLGRIEGDGMLLANTTVRPEPLLGFLSYDISPSKSYKILFIDLCVNFARNQLIDSRAELNQMRAGAETQNGAFQAMVRQLRIKADAYFRLQGLRDFFNLLTYLRYLLGVPAFLANRTAEQQGLYRQLAEQLQGLEKALAEKSDYRTLDQLITVMDNQLRQLRRGAPLLGRLDWEQVSQPDEALAQSVIALIDELLADNAEAQATLEEDAEDIRRLLTVVPPQVMGIPRIVGTVERQQQAQIQGSVDYFWAVQRLKEQAATFQLVLGLASLLFAFFCPPVAIAFGVFSAVVSYQEAAFNDALSDSDVDVDETFVTQAEAREKWFWAGVDAVFAVVDGVGGVRALKTTVQTMRRAGALSELPGGTGRLAELARSADDVAEATTETAQNARTLERLAGATDEEALGRAVADADVDAARRSAQQAETGSVDLSRSRTLDSPPETAQEAIDQATPAVRQSIDQQYFPQIDEAYTRHFEALRSRDLNPLGWDEFARDWQQIQLRTLTRDPVGPSARDGFFDILRRDRNLGEWLSNPGAVRQALVEQVPGRLSDLEAFSRLDKDFLRRFRQAVRRGDDPAALDALVQERFLQRLDDLAAKAGLSGEAGREFGLFASGIGNVGDWEDAAFPALRRLLEDTRIDRNALRQIFNNSSYTRHSKTPRLNMELAIALDRIRDVEGVLNRVSRGNPPLFESLIKGNRGHAFEAIVVSRILDSVEQAGARITVGRRWWLREIDRLNTAEGTTYGNVLEADILLELADGRRILIDAKFFAGGLSISRSLDSQMAKIATGIDEGLIHNGEYWVSHHFTRSREGLTNLDAFQTMADLYSGGRIHLVYDVYEGGFPQHFLDSSRFLAVSRGEVILIPPRADLSVPGGVSGPQPLPPADVTPPPQALIPVAPKAENLAPTVSQSEVIAADARVARNLQRSFVPITPITAAGRVVVQMAPTEDRVESLVPSFVLFGVLADTDLGGTPARELAVGPLTPAERQQILTAITAAPDKLERVGIVDLLDPPIHFYGLGVTARSSLPAHSAYQAVLYSEEGSLVEVFPDADVWQSLGGGDTLLPLSVMQIGDRYIYPFTPGRYFWGLRVRLNGRVANHPKTVPMEVRRG